MNRQRGPLDIRLVSIYRIGITKKDVILVSNIVRDAWCRLSYSGHPNGCPQWGKRDICPPRAPMLYDFMDPTMLVVMEFDLEDFVNRYRERTEYTKRQTFKWLSSGIWWQGRARKLLREVCQKIVNDNPDNMVYTIMPEANGVNCFAMCRKFGIPIVPRPTKRVFEVALVGRKVNKVSGA